ncbi:hypothetical protein [Algoriphagus sp. PAP.12]|uniref:hypothetical protein n=1 Tax=Algoriphagus sp. PAP.12 TaxID=2996678 RepID=UPI00227CAE97|nr:hypothetical protein [Algoriphagus sp. PAP.12]
MFKLFFKNLNQRKRLLVQLLILSFWAGILGTFFKITGNQNGEILLIAGMIFQIVSVAGLVSKWSNHGPR